VRVLVTDAEYKLTLGAIRSLGRRGVEVVAVAAHPRAEGFYSRYAVDRLVGPPPRDEAHFVDFVLETIERKQIDVVLAIGQDSNLALSRARDRVRERAAIAIADWDSMQVAASKRRAVECALELGVPVPHTFQNAADVDRFPVVAKQIADSGQVRYVNSAAELPHGDQWLLQEYVPGEGRGLFALLDTGQEKAVFMHRRLREYPVTGGASTAAESIWDPRLRELGLRLLTKLGWHGVAMVEFKLDRRDGSYRLMEINPKFWGSLDLAIAAGVDFPWLAVQLALRRPITPPSYRAGLRFQWVFSDFVHAAARPRDIPAFLRDLVRAENDLSWRDPRPNAWEAALTLANLLRRARAGTLRHPHGKPGGV
jgi:predicted ATP-grasp superfamily ATP-dependent carboligase